MQVQNKARDGRIAKLRKLQLVEFDILKKIKEICEEYDLTYYLCDGTLLGAVRHGGFIPWDDDADIVMPRPDYENFINIAHKKLSMPYYLQSYQYDEKFKISFARVADKGVKVKSTAMRNSQIWDAWVDIFPLDGMPADRLHFILRKYRILYRRCLYMYSCFDDLVDVSRKRSMHERILINIGEILRLERFLNTQKQIEKLHQVLKQFSFSESQYAASLLGGYKFKSVMKKEIFGKGTKLVFEGIEFNAPEQYDKYLTQIYGDYMTPPPENERNKHCTEIIEI